MLLLFLAIHSPSRLLDVSGAVRYLLGEAVLRLLVYRVLVVLKRMVLLVPEMCHVGMLARSHTLPKI